MQPQGEKIVLEQTGSMRFLNLSFRLFEFGGKFWVPLADLAYGLGYGNPKKLFELVRLNPKLLKEQGWILDGREAQAGGELVPSQGTISAPGTRRDLTLFASYQGVMMLLMLNRSEKADEFKVWACNRLVPAMVRRARRQTPLDDLSPKERTAYLRDLRKMRRIEAERKMLTSPLWWAERNLKNVNETLKIVTQSKLPEDAKACFTEAMTDLRETCYDIQERLKGPGLFGKQK